MHGRTRRVCLSRHCGTGLAAVENLYSMAELPPFPVDNSVHTMGVEARNSSHDKACRIRSRGVQILQETMPETLHTVRLSRRCQTTQQAIRQTMLLISQYSNEYISIYARLNFLYSSLIKFPGRVVYTTPLTQDFGCSQPTRYSCPVLCQAGRLEMHRNPTDEYRVLAGLANAQLNGTISYV